MFSTLCFFFIPVNIPVSFLPSQCFEKIKENQKMGIESQTLIQEVDWNAHGIHHLCFMRSILAA
jgi:hypothetical protein